MAGESQLIQDLKNRQAQIDNILEVEVPNDR